MILARACSTGVPQSVARHLLAGAALLLGLAMPARGDAAPAVPEVLPVQGVLRAAGAGPVPDGKYPILFKLYDGPGAGAQVLFSEAMLGVAVAQGTFAVTIGTGADGFAKLPAGLFAQHGEIWLGAAVAGEPELPRAPLQPVPYALRAVQADAALVADKAKLADKATAADTAALADKATTADEAKLAVLANQAKGLACTGCVTLDMLDDVALSAKSHTALYGGQAGSVQAAIDGLAGRVAAYEQAIPVQGGKIGLGVPAPACGLDVAPMCQGAFPARLVLEVPDETAMLGIQTPGAVVYRADKGAFWGRTPAKWRQIAFLADCGDGAVEPGELCDDGNQDATDACVGCKPATCGDGQIWAGKEQCDDGNAVDTDACIACVQATCGDGKVQAGVEACDQGALNSDTQPNACRKSCALPKCGDKVVDSGETCDDGNTNGGDGCSAQCKSEVLTCQKGSALSQAPSGKAVACQNNGSCEQDKGGDCPVGFHLCTMIEFNAYNDGWSYTLPNQGLGAISCRSGGGAGHMTLNSTNLSQDQGSISCGWGSSNPWCSTGYGCNEKQGIAVCCIDNPACGNGKVEAYETCDDGNQNNGDGCDNNCLQTQPAGCS